MSEAELFLERSNILAKTMRLTLRELAPTVGLSQGAFFSYRTGKMPISSKAWRKLEAAEKAAGIGVEPERVQPPPEDEAQPADDRMAKMEAELGGVRAELSRLAAAVEALAACHAAGHGTSSADRGQARKPATLKKGA